MENENRIPLTRLEACTLMAREAVSLLKGGAEALALLCSAQDLGDGGVLLAWVDAELERARRFAKTGEQTESLVRLDAPLPMPDPAMQLDAVREVLQATAYRHPTLEQWQTALNAAQMLTEMDGLEDMVLGAMIPDGGFLTAEGLSKQLMAVQAAFTETQKRSDAEAANQAMK